MLPISGFPGKTSLGYNPALPFDVKSTYGTNKDFKNFIKTVHAKGIAILLDVVFNHWGPDDLNKALWQIDGWSQNNGGAGDDAIVVVNFSDRSYDSYSIGFAREGIWWVRFNSDWQGYDWQFSNFGGYSTTASQCDPDDSDGMPYRGNVGIAPYSALILSQ